MILSAGLIAVCIPTETASWSDRNEISEDREKKVGDGFEDVLDR